MKIGGFSVFSYGYDAQNTDLSTHSQFGAKEEKEDKKEDSSQTQIINGKELSPSEVQLVHDLERTDREVKAHEAAHLAASGGLASGGASFSYTRGPDGKMYATAGEVPISTQGGSTPQEKIQIARQILAAAMAPADPSAQDYKVAANAMQMEAQARMELNQQIQQSQQNHPKEQKSLNYAIDRYKQNATY